MIRIKILDYLRNILYNNDSLSKQQLVLQESAHPHINQNDYKEGTYHVFSLIVLSKRFLSSCWQSFQRILSVYSGITAAAPAVDHPLHLKNLFELNFRLSSQAISLFKEQGTMRESYGFYQYLRYSSILKYKTHNSNVLVAYTIKL